MTPPSNPFDDLAAIVMFPVTMTVEKGMQPAQREKLRILGTRVLSELILVTGKEDIKLYVRVVHDKSSRSKTAAEVLGDEICYRPRYVKQAADMFEENQVTQAKLIKFLEPEVKFFAFVGDCNWAMLREIAPKCKIPTVTVDEGSAVIFLPKAEDFILVRWNDR